MKKRLIRGIGVPVLVTILTAHAALAERPARSQRVPAAVESIAGDTLAFTATAHYDRAILAVGGPAGFELKERFEGGAPLSTRVRAKEGQELVDGMYRYELRLIDRGGSPIERVHAASFYVESGALVSRQAKRDQLSVVRQQLRSTSSLPMTPGDPAPLSFYTDERLWVWDTNGDRRSSLILEMDSYDIWSVQADDGTLRLEYYDDDDLYDGDKFSFTPLANFGIGTSNPSNNIHMFPPIEGSMATGYQRSPEIYMYAYSDTAQGSISRGWEIGASPSAFFVRDKGDDGMGSIYPLRILADAQNDSIRISALGADFKGDVTVPSGAVRTEELHLASSRAWKNEIEPIDVGDVLTRLSTVPVSEWSFKDDADGVRHIGPMAEDFHEAFDLAGQENDHLSVTDVQGVAIAAIQALDQQVRELREERDRVKQEQEQLRDELTELRALLLELRE